MRRLATAAATLALAAGTLLTGTGSAHADTNMQCSSYTGVSDGWKIGACIRQDQSGFYHGFVHLLGSPGTTDVRYYINFTYTCPTGNHGTVQIEAHNDLARQGQTDVQYETYYEAYGPCKYTAFVWFTESGVTKQNTSISYTSSH